MFALIMIAATLPAMYPSTSLFNNFYEPFSF